MPIPKEKIVEIYDSISDKSWFGFFDEVSTRINKPEGFDDRDLYFLQDLSEKMDDEPFPGNADELYQMIVDRFGE